MSEYAYDMLADLDFEAVAGTLGIEIDMQKDVIERNKDNPVVKLGYDDRFRVWTEQILPDRLEQCNHDNTVEYVERMITLLGQDVHRLLNAAERQLTPGDASAAADDMAEIYQAEIIRYAHEITRIEAIAHEQ